MIGVLSTPDESVQLSVLLHRLLALLQLPLEVPVLDHLISLIGVVLLDCKELLVRQQGVVPLVSLLSKLTFRGCLHLTIGTLFTPAIVRLVIL